jgi:hypothetical protein
VLRRNQGMSPWLRDCALCSGSYSLQGKVYDVTGNKMYQPGNSYNGTLTHVSSHSRSRHSYLSLSVLHPPACMITDHGLLVKSSPAKMPPGLSRRPLPTQTTSLQSGRT